MGKMKRSLHVWVLALVFVFVSSIFPTAAFAATTGTVAAWQIDDVVPDNLAWTSAITYNGYIYLISGANDFVYTNNVYYAKLGGDGSIGPWNTTVNAPYVGSSISMTAHNGYLYYIGGYNGTSITPSAYYAKINADGTLSNWTSTTDTTPNAWSGASVVVNNNYIYMLGGDTGSGYDDSVTYAAINPDGSIGSWTATSSLPETLSGGAAAFALVKSIP